MISVAQEINHLSRLTGTECRDWKHLLVADKVNDPLFEADPEMREAHIEFRTAGDQALVEPLLAGYGITRRLECEADNCYLVPRGDHAEAGLERVTNSFGLAFTFGLVPVAKSIFSFTVPDNFTWVVTHIFLRTLPPINDASLTAVGTSSGDFRSDDFEVNGLAQAWIQVNGNPINAIALTTFAFFNKPLLLGFACKSNVQVMVQRAAASIPPTMIVQTVFHSYLTKTKVYSELDPCTTSIEGTFQANP